MVETVSAKEVLIQYEDTTATSGWSNLCYGAAGLSGNNELITNKVIGNCLDRSQPLTQITEYGVQSFTISLDGIFDDDASAIKEREWFFNQEKPKLRALIPGVIYINCDNWVIGNYDLPGALEGPLELSRTYTNDGLITVVPV